MFEDFKQLTPSLGSSIILKSFVVLNQKTNQELPMESKLSWKAGIYQEFSVQYGCSTFKMYKWNKSRKLFYFKMVQMLLHSMRLVFYEPL